MQESVKQSDYVFVVCSEKYYEQFGKGSTFEFSFITLYLYEHRMQNDRIIPILIDNTNTACIPDILRQYIYFTLPAELDKVLDLISKLQKIDLQIPKIEHTIQHNIQIPQENVHNQGPAQFTFESKHSLIQINYDIKLRYLQIYKLQQEIELFEEQKKEFNTPINVNS